MASAHIEMDVQHHEDSADGRRSDHEPLVKYYRASEPLPGVKPVLHNFLRKGPASWAAVQASSGILSVGIGVMFAASFDINFFLLTLFRVPIVTGILFILTGIMSNVLYRHPELLQTCFFANIVCLIVSVVGMILLSIDLGIHVPHKIQYKMEVLVLCVTLMDTIIAAVLIFLIHREKQNQKH
ncbi:uncharacterized protein si:ch211-269k10.4 [Triplophysa rosa]|uniref:Uncharacterized protein n=1 Tax=Triplophysa rosa TaxID=992332 RepID=A0A9W8C2L2_TRIRA|nr:uncharacterized protein si:ch211-269k10.4 [Triplophysa rosa]KAI7806230.1 hypothetical protein IRJ41_002456 [Triplophysa rosa]